MNATTKHTPGPWRVYRIGERVAVETCENPALIVAAATLTGDPKEQEANARLIAASPTMKALIEEYVAGIGSICGANNREAKFLEDIEDKARAILAALARGS